MFEYLLCAKHKPYEISIIITAILQINWGLGEVMCPT